MRTLTRQEVGISRVERLESEHKKLFGCEPERIFSASGRTELGGNHTDHNLGKVLCGAIDLDSLACVHETMDYNVVVYSKGFEPVFVDISNLEIREDERETTAALIRGVAASIVQRGGNLGGFSANIESLVFPGSGLSSSASVEVLFAKIFSSLFNDDRFSTTELAQIGQEAENRYFGKPCGLMDQVACANGGVVMIDFKDKANPVIEPISADFTKYGYNLVIVDSRSSHADLSSEYALIPADMNAVAGFFGKHYLREVNPDDFFCLESEIENKLGKRAANRARHFFNECIRVEKMVDALKKEDFSSYLEIVNESGRSSENLLCNIIPSNASDSKLNQTLKKASELLNGKVTLDSKDTLGTRDTLGTGGAWRVHGGGFAGTIQVYVPIEETEHFIEEMEKFNGKGCCCLIGIRNTGVGEVL